MTSRTELLEMITCGENSGLEFKRDNLRPEQLAKEVVALANFQGGRILLGVEDDGTITGIQRNNLQEWLMDTVFGRFIHPHIIPFYEEVAIEKGKRVAVVTIGIGTTKPYVVRHHDREEVYIRFGSSSRLASREQQLRLFQSGGLLHAETLPVSGRGFDQLDKRRLEEYLRLMIEDDDIPESEAAWHKKLEDIDLMVATEFSNTVCTIVGLALFGKQPSYGLPQAGIHLLVFPGEDMDYNASLDEVLNIPFTGLHNAIDPRDVLVHSLPDRVLYYLQPYISEERLVSMTRERLWIYPTAVIRELVVNAFAHRDWTHPNKVRLCIYRNRLEIESPGTLPNGMTVEKAGQRLPRNPIMTNILRDYRFMDNRGIRRKIIPFMKQHNGTEPEFEVTEDYVKVTLQH
jgi:ATP-dependent DNA helicase RecG